MTDLLVHLVQGGLGDVESLNIGQVVGPEHQVRQLGHQGLGQVHNLGITSHGTGQAAVHQTWPASSILKSVLTLYVLLLPEQSTVILLALQRHLQ